MKYRRPSRFRRVAKWVGLGACLVILAAWIASVFWYAEIGGLPRWWVMLESGLLMIYWGPSEATFDSYSCGIYTSIELDLDYPPQVLLGLQPPYVRFEADGAVLVPLWLVFIVAAIPTVILWRRDRRPRKGHCPHCGYNLTGAEHEKCPECGAVVAARPEASE